MLRAMTIACVAVPALAAPEGTLVWDGPEGKTMLRVHAESAHAPARNGHDFTIWAIDGEERDYTGDVILALRARRDGRGWAAEGQMTRLDGPAFHGAILDSDYGAAFAVTALEVEDGRVRLVGTVEGPLGVANGDTGSNDFTVTEPAEASFTLELPEGATFRVPPPLPGG